MNSIFKKPRILVIDEDKEFMFELIKHLRPDFEVEYADSVSTGLSLYRRILPELIIISLDIENGKGYQFIKRLRTRDKLTLLIAVSQKLKTARNIMNIIAEGVNEYFIKKRDSMEKIVQSVRNYCFIEEVEMPQTYKIKIENIKRYILENHGMTSNIKVLLKNHGYSIRQMQKFFKAETGKTIKEFIDEIKLNSIAYFMSRGTHISYLCDKFGFCDASSLNKFIKRKTGLTTAQFREECSEYLA